MRAVQQRLARVGRSLCPPHGKVRLCFACGLLL